MNALTVPPPPCWLTSHRPVDGLQRPPIPTAHRASTLLHLAAAEAFTVAVVENTPMTKNAMAIFRRMMLLQRLDPSVWPLVFGAGG